MLQERNDGLFGIIALNIALNSRESNLYAVDNAEKKINVKWVGLIL